MPGSDVPVQVSPRRGAGGTTQHPSGRTTTVAPVLEHEELPSPEPGWLLSVCAQLRTVHSVPPYFWCALQTVHMRTNQSSD